MLLIMWSVFEKLRSEVALNSGTHKVCLAMMANSGQRFDARPTKFNAEVAHVHCIWAL